MSASTHASTPFSAVSGEPALARARAAFGSQRILAALLLFGAALRLIGINRYPFEQDELYTIIESRYLFHSPLHPGIQARPLYYLLEHPLLNIFPATEVWLRLMPFLFGVAGLWATWSVARRIFGTSGAAIATLLAAISPWHLHASGMARYWSLVYLLATLACLSLLDAYRSDRPSNYLSALVCLILGMAVHPTFAFSMVGVAAALMLVRADGRFGWRWPSRRAWLMLWLPLLAFLLAACLALKFTSSQSAVHNWNTRGLAATLKLIPAMVEWMTPTVFVAGGLGALLLTVAPARAEQRVWGAVSLLGTVSAMLGLVASSLRTSVYADYGVAFLPLIFVSAGGLVSLAQERLAAGRGVFAVVSALVLAAGVAPSAVSHLCDGMRFDYRPALRQIERIAPDVPVLSTPIVIQRYYAPALRGQELIMRRAALDSTLARLHDFWLIAAVRRDGIWLDDGGEAAPWIAQHCRLVSFHVRPRFDDRIYRTELHRCRADGTR